MTLAGRVLNGVCVCGLTVATGLTGQAARAQDAAEAPPLPPRIRQTPRTLVFPRAQLKYGLDETYLRRWVDRPLLIDPALRIDTPRRYAMTYPSFRRVLGVVRSYEVDGLAFFPETSGRSGAFEYADQAAAPGLALLPEFIPGTEVEPKAEVLRQALACRSVIRVNGRIPITSYRGDRMTPEEWQTVLTALREEFGDVFFFLPDISVPGGEGWPVWIERFESDAGITAAQREAMKEYLRSYLRVCDGLYMASAAAIKSDRRFQADFYRSFLVPLYREVLAEKEFAEAGKYLGMSACVGHMNCTRLGYTLSEDGTKTLRRSLSAALSAEPDILIIPEWDEQNENTSLRPTVFNSFSSRRIVRYTMQSLKGEKPSPMPGDDTSLPNLVVSYRKLLTLGEVLEIELLNVPDGSRNEPYEVEVNLRAPDGSIAARHPAVTLEPERMSDVTWAIPSERLAAHRFLRPELVIRDRGKTQVVRDGLHHVHLRATWNWDYKWVKQPLRDVCRPAVAAFAVEPVEGRADEVVARGEVRCDEPVASVEVIENGAVVYAADPRPTALRQRDDLAMFTVEYRSLRRVPFRGRISVSGAEVVWPERYKTPDRYWHLEDGAMVITHRADWYQRILYLGIPRAQLGAAVLLIDAPPVDQRIPVQTILEREIISFAGPEGLTVTVSPFWKQDDHPPHFDTGHVSFKATCQPDMPGSIMHMRVITESGRIYRSAPVTVTASQDAEELALTVYSDSDSRPVSVRVDARRVPDIRYDFEPARGAALVCDAGKPFWAHLGGYVDSVTGRGGGASNDGTPFVRRSNYPEDAHMAAPSWVEVDGRPCLHFDGKGTFIAMPQGVLPRRGAFTLSFDIRPVSDRPQILFTHHGTYIGSLTVRLEGGMLTGTFTNADLETAVFRPGLAVPAGAWSHVEIIYDLDSMRFRVNDRVSDAMPCKGPGLYDVTSVFGGFGGGREDPFTGKAGWFEGDLASLRIVHRSGED